MRLEKVLSLLVHPDQVGFIKVLLYLMWVCKSNDIPTTAFSLDVEKAFDRVEWDFVCCFLKKFGFG